MTNIILVQYTDDEGVGFGRDESGPPAPDEFWMVAEQLLKWEVKQPGEAFRKTHPHPVWRFWHQPVGRYGGHWLFTVQGRGGDFGPAGTCRFAFVPETVAPADAWRAAAAWAAAEQGELEAPDKAWLSSSADLVLTAVAMKRGPVLLDGTPAHVAHLIEQVLGVLPDAEVRSRIWSTCLLERLERSGRWISGRWPEQFRMFDEVRARQVDQILSGRPPTRGELERSFGSARRVEEFDKLVGRAARGAPVADRMRGARSLMEMLDWAAARLSLPSRPARPSQDPSAEPGPPGSRNGITDQSDPKTVHRWATESPEAALEYLRSTPGDPNAAVILHGLIRLQQTTPRNVLDLPVAEAPEITQWRIDLAKLMRQHVSDLVPRLRSLVGPDRLWQSTEDLLAARRWLEDLLKIQPADAPDLFPDRLQVYADEANDRPKDFIRRLAEVDDPGQLLIDVAPRLNYCSPDTTARFLRAAADNKQRWDKQRLRQVELAARALTRQRVEQGLARQIVDDDDPAHWLGRMLGALDSYRLENHDFLLAVLYGGLGELIEHVHEPLWDDLLFDMCQQINPAERGPKAVRDELRRARQERGVPATEPGWDSRPAVRPGTLPAPMPYSSDHREPERGRGWRVHITQNRAVAAAAAGLVVIVLATGLLLGRSSYIDGTGASHTAGTSTLQPGPTPATEFMEVPVSMDEPADTGQVLLDAAAGRQVIGVIIIGFDVSLGGRNIPDGQSDGAQRAAQLEQRLKANPKFASLSIKSYGATGTAAHPAGSTLVTLVLVKPQ